MFQFNLALVQICLKPKLNNLLNKRELSENPHTPFFYSTCFMNKKISRSSRILLGVAAILLLVSIFTPIWRIELDAPQYPEGLCLKIYADKISGDLEIINGLNHYIGMKTLHTKDFIEFSILTYVISFYVLITLVAAIIGSKKLLVLVFSLFVFFGIIALIDFWRWEYNYGHDLNPNAAIIVPGMAYQPPLIGFKQLLNFGAYSVPDIGGWLFISSGILMLIANFLEARATLVFKKLKKLSLILLVGISIGESSCSENLPQPIKVNLDNCDYCNMMITDLRFTCEVITSKGKVFMFDDLGCLVKFKKENHEKLNTENIYISDFLRPYKLTKASLVFFVSGGKIQSPMRGNTIGFSSKDSALIYLNSMNAKSVSLNNLNL